MAMSSNTVLSRDKQNYDSGSEVALSAPGRADESRALRVALVLLSDFSGPSETQALGLAQELCDLGHSVMLCVNGDPGSLQTEGFGGAENLQVGCYRFSGTGLDRASLRLVQQFEPDLVHAWGPMLPQLMATRDYVRATNAPAFVHFEDNHFDAWPIMPEPGRLRRIRTRASRTFRSHLWRLHPPLWGGPHSAGFKWIKANASGLDALTPTLSREVENRLGRPCSSVLPVLPDVVWPKRDRKALSENDEQAAVLFTGRLSASSIEDFLIGVRAIAELRTRGHLVRLFQTGTTFDGIDPPALAKRHGLDADGFKTLGHVPFSRLPALLMAADVLVQPGPPSEFNRLRLPSKMQTYLASGTPTVTFGVGFGEMLIEGEEVLMTHTDQPEELANCIEALLSDQELHRRIGQGGRKAASRLFDRRRNTNHMLSHYRDGLASPSPVSL